MLRLYFVAVFTLLASYPIFAISSQNEVEDAYKKGSDLLVPYFVLTDRRGADPNTVKGKSDIAEGIRLLKIVMQSNPNNWSAVWQIGKGYQAVGDHFSAYKSFKRAYEINPQHNDIAREYMIECICVEKTGEAVRAPKQRVRPTPMTLV